MGRFYKEVRLYFEKLIQGLNQAYVPRVEGATVIEAAIKTTPDMAAFVNATTARYVELNDVYRWPGSAGGHPSDVVMLLLCVAEHARAFQLLTICGTLVFRGKCSVQ